MEKYETMTSYIQYAVMASQFDVDGLERFVILGFLKLNEAKKVAKSSKMISMSLLEL